jgi:hypothetical protein
MALIDQLTALCNRLAPGGWAKLFKLHGLDITAADLRKELERDLDAIVREAPGFEDFAFEGRRGIEPGSPSRSLVYHALASPNVQGVDGTGLTIYPTLQELEIVENYVFARKAPSLPELTAIADGSLIAVVVFAYEYRPGVDTVHRRHADLCFSRIGVARVGTKELFYDPRSRGFLPFTEGDDDHAIRVLPARYAAYVAVQRSGNEQSFGPMRFSFQRRNPDIFPGSGDRGDENRKFCRFTNYLMDLNAFANWICAWSYAHTTLTRS